MSLSPDQAHPAPTAQKESQQSLEGSFNTDDISVASLQFASPIPMVAAYSPVQYRNSAISYTPDPSTLSASEASGQSFACPIPLPLGFRNEPYAYPSYPGSYQHPMNGSNSQPMDLQQVRAHARSYYPDYGSACAPPSNFMPGRTMSSLAQAHGFAMHAYPPNSLLSSGTDQFQSNDIGKEGGQILETGQAELLRRVESAIPDLHLLLDLYREMSVQLEARKKSIRQAEAQRAEMTRQKEAYIDGLVKELEESSRKHSTERCELRLQISSLEEKHKELQDESSSMLAEKERLEVAHRDLQGEFQLLLDGAEEGNRNVIQDFQLWKNKAHEEFEKREDVLGSELQDNIKAEVSISESLFEIEENRRKELAKLDVERRQKRSDLEAQHSNSKQDIQAALAACQDNLEDALREVQEARWSKAEDILHDGDCDTEQQNTARSWEGHTRDVQTERDEKKKPLCQGLQSIGADKSKLLQEENTVLRQEVERLKIAWEADKINFAKATTELKSVAANLDMENANLQRMLEALGEVTDFKSRGDAYL